jgi:dihydroflavonol-4-reductase
MKVLLTGGTGFLGSHILRLLLQQGHEVCALQRSSSRKDLVSNLSDRVHWLEGDVTDLTSLETAFEGIEKVIHCAAVVSFHPKDRRQMMQINVEGTANMVNYALDAGVQQFIHVSSIAAIGRSATRRHLSEVSKWETSSYNSQYAISKYLAEQEVWRAAAEGLSVSIVNPSVILGSGFWGENTSMFFQRIDNGLRFYPTGATGFVDVEDVATFILLLLESGKTSERYLLNGENLSYQTLFGWIAAALDVPAPSVPAAPWMAELAWRIEWLREKLMGSTPLVTKESARSSVNRFTFDNSKSLSIFPNFKYTPIQQTVETAARLYRNQYPKVSST